MKKLFIILFTLLALSACDSITVTETSEVTTQDIATATMPFPEDRTLP